MSDRLRVVLFALLVAGVAVVGCGDERESSVGDERSFNAEEGEDHDNGGQSQPDGDGEEDTDEPAQEEQDHDHDGDTETEPNDEADGQEEPIEDPDWSPYDPGPLEVLSSPVDDGPAPMVVFYPDDDGSYPLVVFQHGFLMANTYYSDVLSHVASHGFVVAAPQMYESGGLPIGTPSTGEEAVLANEVYDWLGSGLGAALDIELNEGSLALAGHSRGSKVIWWALGEESWTIDAFIGVDPVDGTGGPFGNEDEVTDTDVDLGAPVLLIGAGLGSESAGFGQPACAPEGDNYAAFFEATASPAWQVVAPDYGHLDMLDDETDGCGLACSACVEGDARAPMRQLVGGLMVAALRAAQYEESWAVDWLGDESAAPVEIQTIAK